MFRKGKALGEQGFFQKAEKVLEDLKSKNPSGVYSDMSSWCSIGSPCLSDKELVDQEIKRLRVIDKEREKVHRQNMKGTEPFFLLCSRSYCSWRILEQSRKEGQRTGSSKWWVGRGKRSLYWRTKGVATLLLYCIFHLIPFQYILVAFNLTSRCMSMIIQLSHN